MTPIINGIPIRVRIDSKDIRTSMISFDDTGPSIILENKRITGKSSTNERISYSVKTEEESSILPITSKDWVYLEPIFMTKRFFSKKPHQVDDMYPKSSDGWLSHLTYDGIAVYIVAQEIENDKKFLLSFYDAKSGEVYKSLKVNNYEVAILRQLDDFSVHEQIIEQNPDADRKYLESILDDDPPSWNQIAKLVEGVTIPGLQQKENMRETVAQLVPSSFPDEIREEVMAFLAWSINARIPNEDPIDYGDRFLTVRIFRSLVIGHLQCMIDNQKPPHYVRIMAMAERESLSPPKWPMTVPAEQSPWLKAYYSLIEAFPNWLGRVVEYTKVLNQEKKIALQNPVTKSMARKSKTAWGERFSLYVNSIIMRSEINNNALGLKYLIYLGGAHKWPHNHLSWSARLGQPGPQAH